MSSLKKYWPTLLLVVVFVAGLLYAKSENFFREEEKTSNQQALVQLDYEEIVGLKLTRGDAVIELTRNGDTWAMLAPEEYPVEQYIAENVARNFTRVVYEQVITDTPASLADYGLEEPELEVEVILDNGTSVSMLIGSALPVYGSKYVKLSTSPEIYEVKNTEIDLVDKETFDFLDKTVFPFMINDVTKVEMSWQGKGWTLSKNDALAKAYQAEWTLEQMTLDGNGGSGILDKIRYLDTRELPVDKTTLDWSNPQMTMVITEQPTRTLEDGTVELTGETKVSTYHGIVEGEQVYVAEESGKWAFKVKVEEIEEIFAKGFPEEVETDKTDSATDSANSE